MKKFKLLSIVTAAMMSVSMLFGAYSASAEYATGDLEVPQDVKDAFYSQFHKDETPDKIYTLEELFAMSDEEFFALEYAEDYFGTIKSDAERVSQVFNIIEYGGISGSVMRSVLDKNVNYTANITEMEIEKLLGDTVEYEIISPISLDPDYLMDNLLFYGDIFWVEFPEYNLYSQRDNITHKEIIEFTKCWYCVNQVIEIYYFGYGAALAASPSTEQVIEGDVNFDKKIDLQDVIWLSKGLVKQFKLTDAQLIIADVNKDGVVNVFDAILISRKLFKK